MKVVLFCGGQGLRMREYSDTLPKPLVPIGSHPILWHLMMYYAHFGHREFILCLGWQGHLIREYFLNLHGIPDERFGAAFQCREGLSPNLRALAIGRSNWSIPGQRPTSASGSRRSRNS